MRLRLWPTMYITHTDQIHRVNGNQMYVIVTRDRDYFTNVLPTMVKTLH